MIDSSFLSDHPKEAVAASSPQSKEDDASHHAATARTSSTSSSIVPPKHPASRSLLINLPQELLNMIVSNSLIPYNSGFDPGFDPDLDPDLYADMDPDLDRYEYMDSGRISFYPQMPTLTQVNRRLRFLTLLASFRGAKLQIFHDTVAKTVDFLYNLPAPVRNSIQELIIFYQRRNPVDYMSFHVLCGILNTMTGLKVLKIRVPTSVVALSWFHAPGKTLLQLLHDELNWWRYDLVDFLEERYAWRWNSLSRLGWRTAPTAIWILDLLSVHEPGLSDFKLVTYDDDDDGERLANFLKTHMLEDRVTRGHLIEQLKKQLEERRRRHAFFWEFLAILWHFFFKEMATVWFACLDFLS